MADLDIDSWTLFESFECECIDAKTGKTQTSAGLRDAIILILNDHQSGKELVCFINAKKNKSGHYSVPRNGKFAKLYRQSIGANPQRRLSKSQQLMKHLIGVVFHCEYQKALDSSGLPYLKVFDIRPNTILLDEAWFPDGTLRKSRRKLKTRANQKHSTTTGKDVGNKVETSRNRSGNFLETQKPVNPCHVWDEEVFPSRNNVYTSKVGTCSSVLDEKGMSIDIRNNGGVRERIVRFSQLPGESYNEYLDRVVNDSWNL